MSEKGGGDAEKVARFSVADYAREQWELNYGQPYGIIKRVYFNGTVDSLETNVIQMDWTPVFKVFFETDISDDKYDGKYKLSSYRDTAAKTVNFYYEATDPKVYTRKFQITANDINHKITSLYIEAEKDDRLGTKTVRLLYTPLETISIQEMETSKTGQRKELRVVYEIL